MLELKRAPMHPPGPAVARNRWTGPVGAAAGATCEEGGPDESVPRLFFDDDRADGPPPPPPRLPMVARRFDGRRPPSVGARLKRDLVWEARREPPPPPVGEMERPAPDESSIDARECRGFPVFEEEEAAEANAETTWLPVVNP